MPSRNYFNIKTKQIENVLSDSMECNDCQQSKFEMIKNPEFLSGEEEMEWIRVCKICGGKVKIDKDRSKEKNNYVLYDEYLRNPKEYDQGKSPALVQKAREHSDRMKIKWQQRKMEQENKTESVENTPVENKKE